MSAWAKESSPLVYCGFKKNKNKITDGFWHFGITVAFRSGVLVGIFFFQWGKKLSVAFWFVLAYFRFFFLI
jgi:hypothetical protein